MYNDDIKQEYLRSIDNIKIQNNLVSTFTKSEDIEKMFNKDLCNFIRSDFIFLFERNKYFNKSTFNTVKSNIKKYVTWCSAKKYCNSNSINEISGISINDINGMYKINTEYYFSIDELVSTIDFVFKNGGYEPEYYSRIILYYSLFWFQYTKEEIHHLKKTNINLSEGKITVNNFTTIIPECLIKFCDIALNCDQFHSISGKKMDLKQSNYIFRTVKSDEPPGSSYMSNVMRIWKELLKNIPPDNKYYNKQLLIDVISKCGLMYEIYQQIEEEGKTVTVQTIQMVSRTPIPEGQAYVLIDNYRRWRDALISRPH